MRKILYTLFTLLIALTLFACNNNGTNDETLVLAENANISIDGFVDEQAYDIIQSKKTGVKGNVLVKYAADKEGLYFALVVTDNKHEVARTGIVNSDYVGIAI